MITAWTSTGHGLVPVQLSGDILPENLIWLDVVDISKEEEGFLERTLGIEVPTREEMREIERSSRLYREGNAIYATSTMLHKTDTDMPLRTPVTFILTDNRLVTLRYADLFAFRTYNHGHGHSGKQSAEGIMSGLIEASVERLADILLRLDDDLERYSQAIFNRKHAGEQPSIGLEDVLFGVGRVGNALGKVRESLVDKHRLAAFLEQSAPDWLSAECRNRLRGLLLDTGSLSDHATFISNKISFLNGATLGFISIQQNNVIKIFTIVSIVLVPPVLVASIYGMNFEHMPELKWMFGYPMAIGAMIISAIVPWWIAKRRGWL